tara:strand:- start:130 stop:585 length:456 start_codon:yes stop_codon:yes gene_type:complete
MNPTIQKLNDTICEDYTVSIVCDRSTILDSYEEGELEEVYHTTSFYERSFDTNPDFLSSGLKAAIENVLKNYSQYDTFEECIKENFSYSDCDFIVLRHVTESFNDPSKEEVELWKKGEINLYNQYTHIKVKVNDRLIDLDLIKALVEMENK